MTTSTISQYLLSLKQPALFSHKGQNGKLLLIGGSDLFHAASKWSLDVASHFVDMLFYASVPSNNELVTAAKGQFWNGIVVERTDIESYLKEADVVLIGPGMERAELKYPDLTTPPTEAEWQHSTEKIVNYLLKKYPTKKWVIDAGALQMVDPALLGPGMIITPHIGELERVTARLPQSEDSGVEQLTKRGIIIVLKGRKEYVYFNQNIVEIEGGDPGMTKGGTGDVLAGLIAALYTTNDAATAAVVGSYINKRAGEVLATEFGSNFNASELVQAIPKTLHRELELLKKTS